MFAKTPRTALALALLAKSTVLMLSGCEEPRQKVLDVKAPGVSIEVERSKSGGSLNVETGQDGSGAKLEIDADADDGARAKVEPKK